MTYYDHLTTKEEIQKELTFVTGYLAYLPTRNVLFTEYGERYDELMKRLKQ